MINLLEMLMKSKEDLKDHEVFEGILQGLYQIIFEMEFESKEI
jgi:hypothetical protein